MTINSLTYHRRDTSERATYLSVLAWMIEHREEKHTRVSDNPDGSFWMKVESSDHRTVGAWGIPVSHRAIVCRFSTDGTVTLYPRRRLRCTNPQASSEYSYSCTIGRKTYRTLPTTLHYSGGEEANHIEIRAWYIVDHTDPNDRPGFYAPIREPGNPTHFTPDSKLIGWAYHGEEPPPYVIDWSAYPDIEYPDAFYARHSYCHPWTLPYTVH